MHESGCCGPLGRFSDAYGVGFGGIKIGFGSTKIGFGVEHVPGPHPVK